MNLEDCIKDLSPELQEKARACGSVEELVALAKEEKEMRKHEHGILLRDQHVSVQGLRSDLVVTVRNTYGKKRANDRLFSSYNPNIPFGLLWAFLPLLGQRGLTLLAIIGTLFLPLLSDAGSICS